MPFTRVPFWKKMPFVRLLTPLILGILAGWHFQTGPAILLSGMFLSAGFILFFPFISFFNRYRAAYLNGIAVSVFFTFFGSLLVRHQDSRYDKQWYGQKYKSRDALVIILDEPLVEKERSLKARAMVTTILQDERQAPVTGTLLVYFNKDSLPRGIGYGSRLIIRKTLQPIRSSGNPGGFDYARYCLFQGILHQVYLKTGEFEVLEGKKEAWLDKLLYSIRDRVLISLRSAIKGEKELGLAEALLIGYKDDLDKTLVQSYTNTGVVHIVAISGLHLGLIYALLVALLKPLRRMKQLAWLGPVIIVAGLWLFSLLAGGQPSVLRSAVMFTCIVAGESLGRKGSIFNTLAVSAFILLCINPFWLWDVGFQLSYAAVLSIVIFMKPVYHLLYIKNKLLDHAWKLNAVTISAQVLTIPLCIYHFHQFPNYFLLTNFIAVPLSSAALIGEILICCVSFFPFLVSITGTIVCWIIRFMNTYIERIEMLPGSVWNGLQISLVQAVCLSVCLCCIAGWLMERSKAAGRMGLLCLVLFLFLRSLSLTKSGMQEKLIVYNIARGRAMDIVNGNRCLFIGDTALLSDGFTARFHLAPCRTMYRATPAAALKDLHVSGNCLSFHTTRILLLGSSVSFSVPAIPQTIDLLIVSGNPEASPATLKNSFTVRQVVLDGSVPSWKIKTWQHDCDSIGWRCHDVTAKGAFVMTLQ